MVQGKAHHAVSLLVQLVFSKDGGSDGVNSEVRWAGYLRINQPNILFYLLRSQPNFLSINWISSHSIPGLGHPYALFGRRGKIFFIRDVFIFIDTQRFIEYYVLSLLKLLIGRHKICRALDYWGCQHLLHALVSLFLFRIRKDNTSHTLTYHAANLLHKYIYIGLVTSLITLPQLLRPSKGWRRWMPSVMPSVRMFLLRTVKVMFLVHTL